MESILEQQRRLHEEIERLEKKIVKILLNKPKVVCRRVCVCVFFIILCVVVYFYVQNVLNQTLTRKPHSNIFIFNHHIYLMWLFFFFFISIKKKFYKIIIYQTNYNPLLKRVISYLNYMKTLMGKFIYCFINSILNLTITTLKKKDFYSITVF